MSENIKSIFEDECKGSTFNLLRNDGQSSTIILSTEDWLKKEKEQLEEIKKERKKIDDEVKTVKMELEQVKNSLNQQKAELERINSETETARSNLTKIKSTPKIKPPEKQPDTVVKPASSKPVEKDSSPEKKLL